MHHARPCPSDLDGSVMDVERRVISMQQHRALRRTAQRFDPSQMRSWEQTKPWNLSQEDAEFQRVDGWSFKRQRGTEVASYERGSIAVSPEFFTYPEETRRAIAYHEAGHAMLEAAGGLRALDDPLGLVDLPGGQSLSYNAEEIVAEAYSVLWTEPEWFERMHADEIRSIVIGLARKAGFPLPPNVKSAMPSWRGLVNGPVWDEYPGVILVDKTGGGRQSYEVYVGGRQIGRGRTLDDAKAMVESKIGPCTFQRVRQEPIRSDHYYWGVQDWFGDPQLAYAAIPVS